MREFFFAFIFFKVGKLLPGFFLGQRALKGTAGVTVNFRAFLTLQAQPEKEGEYGLNILCFVLGISWSKSGRFFLLFCYNCSSQERTKSLLWINWETITWKYKAIAKVHQSVISWWGHSWAGWWECCGVPTWCVASPAAVQGRGRSGAAQPPLGYRNNERHSVTVSLTVLSPDVSFSCSPLFLLSVASATVTLGDLCATLGSGIHQRLPFFIQLSPPLAPLKGLQFLPNDSTNNIFNQQQFWLFLLGFVPSSIFISFSDPYSLWIKSPFSGCHHQSKLHVLPQI